MSTIAACAARVGERPLRASAGRPSPMAAPSAQTIRTTQSGSRSVPGSRSASGVVSATSNHIRPLTRPARDSFLRAAPAARLGVRPPPPRPLRDARVRLTVGPAEAAARSGLLCLVDPPGRAPAHGFRPLQAGFHSAGSARRCGDGGSAHRGAGRCPCGSPSGRRRAARGEAVQLGGVQLAGRAQRAQPGAPQLYGRGLDRRAVRHDADDARTRRASGGVRGRRRRGRSHRRTLLMSSRQVRPPP